MEKTQTSSLDGRTKNSSIIGAPASYRLIVDPNWGRAAATAALHARQLRKPSEELSVRAGKVTRDPYHWVTEYTETFNQHWVEEGRPSPYEPFPKHAYFVVLFEMCEAERINWFEKSRDMMVSWACVAYLTVNAMTVPEREVLFQCQKEDKVKQLVKYAKFLYSRQPQWLQDAYPLTKPLRAQPELELHFAHGGKIVGVPGGADQVRSYHPWGYLNDESSFQPDAGECYNEALSAVKGKIIFNSSAAPGWYADARRDIIRNSED